MSKNLTCPCDSGFSYSQCCQPLHLEQQFAQSAEQLMRSRYSAYALELRDYLLQSWHPDTRPAAPFTLQDNPKWIGLKIQRSWQEADTAYVEFTARYKTAHGRAAKMHEISRFQQLADRWYYLDGKVD